MFTGIVEELGEVISLERSGDSAVLAINGQLVASTARDGDSIAVNGVCLTVIDTDGKTFRADVMGETLARSSLGVVQAGELVNLERAVAADGRLGGHVVQGHVDGTGEIVQRIPGDSWETVRFQIPTQLSRYVAEKGSIAVDGVSLTVVEANDDNFTVGLIPTTLTRTTLGYKGIGAPVNIEVDVLAKYTERLLSRSDA